MIRQHRRTRPPLQRRRPPAGMTTAELRQRAGATVRQITYWMKLGLLKSSATPDVSGQGVGNERGFTNRDLLVARALTATAALPEIKEQLAAQVYATGLPLEVQYDPAAIKITIEEVE
jgi:DNA-binding transcriptional MerR regulator